MPLSPGVRLGPYEIQAAIGAGGMGEVYKARDTRLDRTVAIKVLPSHVASDPDLRQRLEREARAVAGLNHPHICTLHDVGQQDGIDYLVMEYLEGQTLADRLQKGALRLDQTLQYAIQIADALDKAHRAGIVHRDLKPANIMLTRSGVKLLDFGLAKLAAAPPIGVAGLTVAATQSSPLTGQGTILGTLQYMAPEQLEGKEADARTDGFAFGAVLYEMLTGKKAFEGTSQASLIAAIFEHEPAAVSSVQPLTPPALERIVKKCLAKDPDDRWQTARDLLDELKWVTAATSQVGALVGDSRGGEESRFPRRGPGRSIAAVAGFVVGSLAATTVVWIFLRLDPQPPKAVSRFNIALSTTDSLSGIGNSKVVALSPDGSRLVYVANNRLYLRAMDQLAGTPIAGTEMAPGAGGQSPEIPFFSPDGQWIGFWENAQLKKVWVNGGAPVAMGAVRQSSGATWGADDTIVFGQGSAGIWRVPGAGGTPEVLIKMEAGQSAHAPELLPGGRNVLFTLASGNDWDQAQIVVQSLDTGRRQTLVQGSDARYVSTGHLVYALRGSLLAVPFDSATLKVTGGPVPLVEGVLEFATLTPELRGATQFSLSPAGSLVYLPSSAATNNRRLLTWVDRQGHEQAVAAPARVYDYPRISPDGTRVAVEVRDQENDIWIWDFARTTLTRLTFSPGFDNYPIWTRDGRHVVFGSDSGLGFRNLFRRAADGSGPIEQLTKDSRGQLPYSFTPDGKSLVYRDDDPTGYDLGIASIEGSRPTAPLLHTPFSELNADLSPDGRWMVYQSDESGQNEIYVRPFPRVEDGRWQVSTGGGQEPVWARSGRELFYVAGGGRVMAVGVQTQPTFASRSPENLFERPDPGTGSVGRHFDVAPDGKSFLMIKREAVPSGEAPSLIVVQNWTEELKRRVPTNK
jgi:serine/threonine protein kinase/Tol biopolymer transport system component